MVYMYHSFLIHSSADGHLGCFHVLAMTNSTHAQALGNQFLLSLDFKTWKFILDIFLIMFLMLSHFWKILTYSLKKITFCHSFHFLPEFLLLDSCHFFLIPSFYLFGVSGYDLENSPYLLLFSKSLKCHTSE